MAVKFEAIIFTEDGELEVVVVIVQNQGGYTQQELDLAMHLNSYVGDMFKTGTCTTTVVSPNEGSSNVH